MTFRQGCPGLLDQNRRWTDSKEICGGAGQSESDGDGEE